MAKKTGKVGKGQGKPELTGLDKARSVASPKAKGLFAFPGKKAGQAKKK